MAERKLTALPWYCTKCGRRHDASERIFQCLNALCKARNFVTFKNSDLAWERAVFTFSDKQFLRKEHIEP